MTDILGSVCDIVEGSIDFKGQSLAEIIQYISLTFFGIVAFIYGYTRQDIQSSLIILLGGLVVTILLVVPPWPFYNKHPVKWLPAGSGAPNYQHILLPNQ